MFGGRLGGKGSSLLSPFTAGHPPGGCEREGGAVSVVVVGECAREMVVLHTSVLVGSVFFDYATAFSRNQRVSIR